MHKEIRRKLVIDMICCGMSKQAPDWALAQVELLRKILDCSSLSWEVLCNAQADDRVHTGGRVALVGFLLVTTSKTCSLE